MIVLRLINGENIICRIDVDVNSLEDLDACNYITVYDPMSIDRDEEGMKLRDCLMLSQDDKLIIRANDIITLYTPAERLVEYYTKALVYSKGFTKPMVNEQMNKRTRKLGCHTPKKATLFSRSLDLRRN